MSLFFKRKQSPVSRGSETCAWHSPSHDFSRLPCMYVSNEICTVPTELVHFNMREPFPGLLPSYWATKCVPRCAICIHHPFQQLLQYIVGESVILLIRETQMAADLGSQICHQWTAIITVECVDVLYNTMWVWGGGGVLHHLVTPGDRWQEKRKVIDPCHKKQFVYLLW
jgi:hypothetical protein